MTRKADSRRSIAGLLAVAVLIWSTASHAVSTGPDQLPDVTQAPAPGGRGKPQLLAKAGQAKSVQARSELSEATPIKPRGRVYLFRGALGPIFSTGMDTLAAEIVKAGLPADTYEFTLCPFVAESVIKKYRQDPQPIILIGHSMGGSCTVQISERLQEEGIPVALDVSIDPAHLSDDVPANVERFIAIFLSKDILGGGDIKAVAGFPGHYASYDMKDRDEVSHITIEKSKYIHAQILTKILQLTATPAKGRGEPQPLRYVVPPNADYELWDSGMKVSAHAGDTLQTLAAQYHVPLWSLTQANPMEDDMPLASGQQVVVPRTLEPLKVVAEPNTAGR